MTVRDLLSDESKWCQGIHASDKNGKAMTLVDVINSECERYSLLGAIYKCYNIDAYFRIKRVKAVINQEDIVRWNDAPGRTFAEVRRVVEEAGI